MLLASWILEVEISLNEIETWMDAELPLAQWKQWSRKWILQIGDGVLQGLF